LSCCTLKCCTPSSTRLGLLLGATCQSSRICTSMPRRPFISCQKIMLICWPKQQKK
ncbi:hypothetical protein ACJMK2_034008, partial [Sinanodonta woodiana]